MEPPYLPFPVPVEEDANPAARGILSVRTDHARGQIGLAGNTSGVMFFPHREPEPERDPVDTDVPVETMPAWANPAFAADPEAKPSLIGSRFRCKLCDVDWHGVPTCWSCGADVRPAT